MGGHAEEEFKLKKEASEITAFYDREAYKLIHQFIEIHKLENYKIEYFAVECISGFLMEHDYRGADLPMDKWSKVIRMYMEIIKIDWEFLDGIYAEMKTRH